MKASKLTAAVIAILIIAAAAIPVGGLLAPSDASAASLGSSPDSKSITVTATGKIIAEPDMATITLGVETRNAVAGTAQSENSSKMQTVINSLTAAGIDKKDIKTSGYSIYTDYKYSNGESIPNGYVVSNTVTAVVHDIKKLGAVIDAAGKSGANYMGGVSFGVSNYAALYNDALKEAVKSAKSKGDALASAIGVTIGNPYSIVEGSQSYVNYGGFETAKASYDTAAGTPIEVGTSEITATITVTYTY